MKNFTKMALPAIILMTIALSACTQEVQPVEPQAESPLEAAQPPEQQPQSQPAPQPAQNAFPFPFSTEELNGNTITEAALGDNELFFVYFWATWCRACVNSVPGLVEMANEFADDISFVTLLGDFDTARDAAIRITDGAPFYTLNANDSDLAQLLELVRSRYVPTSVIIDASGNVIGEQIIGGGTDRFRTAIEYALNR